MTFCAWCCPIGDPLPNVTAWSCSFPLCTWVSSFQVLLLSNPLWQRLTRRSLCIDAGARCAFCGLSRPGDGIILAGDFNSNAASLAIQATQCGGGTTLVRDGSSTQRALVPPATARIPEACCQGSRKPCGSTPVMKGFCTPPNVWGTAFVRRRAGFMVDWPSRSIWLVVEFSQVQGVAEVAGARLQRCILRRSCAWPVAFG